MSAETAGGSTRTRLPAARVVTPDGVVPKGRVVVEGDQVAAVERDVGVGARSDRDVPARLVLPGLIDVHGDDFEGHLFPRPGARTDLPAALAACDRATIAAGITTKVHAVAFEDTPDDQRSVELAEDVLNAIAEADLLVDHRVNARCEVTNPAAVEAVCGALDRGVVALASLMCHVPGEGQFEDAAAFRRQYVDGGRCVPGSADRLARRRAAVPESTRADRVDRVLDGARRAGVPVASHDDEDPEVVADLADRGVDICEYPTTMAAARRAADCGLATVMGAPNLVRGESLWGNLSARRAAGGGVLDALATDYHPPSLLASLFVDTGESLAARTARVATAPADALGLTDRGRIEPGARADLIVVDPDPIPTVTRAFRAGTEVYRAGTPGACKR
jgi:alpha-D-ribose 1-methylphosphonate 5-triphosphate diphosphatase